MAISINAQTEHVKFMGIPLNGTITQFQQKLQAKGIEHDQEGSRELGPGSRLFKGTFAGEKAEIYINYDANTKIVYRGKAVVRCLSLSIANQLYENLRINLENKYDRFEPIKRTSSDGYSIMNLGIPGSNGDLIGEVDIWVSKNEYSYSFPYTVYIDYWDFYNNEKHESSINDDL